MKVFRLVNQEFTKLTYRPAPTYSDTACNTSGYLFPLQSLPQVLHGLLHGSRHRTKFQIIFSLHTQILTEAIAQWQTFSIEIEKLKKLVVRC